MKHIRTISIRKHGRDGELETTQFEHPDGNVFEYTRYADKTASLYNITNPRRSIRIPPGCADFRRYVDSLTNQGATS